MTEANESNPPLGLASTAGLGDTAPEIAHTGSDHEAFNAWFDKHRSLIRGDYDSDLEAWRGGVAHARRLAFLDAMTDCAAESDCSELEYAHDLNDQTIAARACNRVAALIRDRLAMYGYCNDGEWQETSRNVASVLREMVLMMDNGDEYGSGSEWHAAATAALAAFDAVAPGDSGAGAHSVLPNA